ncbi:hypothetical protein K435DRAFT_620854, partial [Dendrothele bispora CBS 962.96]
AVEYPDETAGAPVGMNGSIHERWRKLFKREAASDEGEGVGLEHHPFASELDWKLAQWALSEKISQRAFNRLLQIPEVKERLGLSFHNAKSMLKAVDSIPERCGEWQTKRIRFQDRAGRGVDEAFTIYHRDPIKAIQALWGDPALADHLVYKPSRMFADGDQSCRIYSEMWTGKWWWAVQ